MFTPKRGWMKRERQAEIMDDAALDSRLHLQALRGLRRVNFWSNTARTFWRPIREFAAESAQPLKILDLATGGGDVPLSLWHLDQARCRRLAQSMPGKVSISGCDKSDVAIEYAAARAKEAGAAIQFFTADVLQEVPSGYDILMSSLFFHHLDPEQVVLLLSRMKQARLVLVSDLLRSRSSLALTYVATRLLSRSHVVHVDGPRSVHAAYTMDEMQSLAREAGLHGARFQSVWPYRMLMCWRRS